MSAGDIPICFTCGLALYPGLFHDHDHSAPKIIYDHLNLVIDGKFISHSGKELDFKFDCDAFSDKDIEGFAKIISRKIRFSEVIGIPTGGTRLALALNKYTTYNSCLLIVDDVLTTGKSMQEERIKAGRLGTLGAVIIARGPCPDWIHSILQFNPYYI